jgi:hypothetical protein
MSMQQQQQQQAQQVIARFLRAVSDSEQNMLYLKWC